MNFIKHFFKRNLCVDSIYIDESEGGLTPVLRCKECGREMGFIYSDSIKWKAFIHVGFRRFRLEIEKWVVKHTQERENNGTILEQQWGALLSGLCQQCTDSLYTVGCEGGAEESEEDSDIEEPTTSAREDDFGLDDMATVH